jgi:DNA primase
MVRREIIEEILMRNDIESLIGSYISLKRAGSNLKGLCPFHNEKTPSFTVYPSDNSFYCFGCGVGGNAISFVRQAEHLDYPDAIRFLAKRAGITVVDDEMDKTYRPDGLSKDRLLRMNTEAAKFFNRSLYEKNPKSEAALSYFKNTRGLSVGTINHFGLGFAPDSFDALLKHMLSLGYNHDELLKGFFIGRTENGKYYDAFRNRVMFPIIDVAGNVIAFGGRVMDDSKPKYRNTMDTVAFKKSRNLFALNFARHSCQDSLILCEGYMDVIALHAAGFTNAVATLGTAITPEQARLMSRYTKKVLITYDSDEAGQKAAQKAIKLITEVGLDVGVLRLSGAKDPDEFIKKYGKDKFSEIISRSKSKFEYNMDSVLGKYNLSLPQDKINAISELEKLISAVYSSAEREIYIKTVSEKFGVNQKSIQNDVERLLNIQRKNNQKNESQKIILKSQGYTDKINLDFAKAPEVAICEESVLGLMMLYPEHLKSVFSNSLLTSKDFYTDFNRRVFEFIKESYESGVYINVDFNEAFSPDEVSRITKMRISRIGFSENGPSVLEECIASLKNALSKKSAEKISTIDDLANLINQKQNNLK